MRHYFVPKRLDLSRFSRPEKVARFLDMLIRRRFLDNLRTNRIYQNHNKDVFYSDRWVRIPSRTLKGIANDYSVEISELREQKVIDRSYFDKGEAFGYRFLEPYCDDLITCFPVPVDDYDRFDQELRKIRQREYDALEDKPEGYRLALEHLNLITLKHEQADIDGIIGQIWKQDEAEKRRNKKPKGRGKKPKKHEFGMKLVHQCNHVLFKLHEITEGRNDRLVPFYKVDAYGRFHHFLTNLRKSLRPFVRLNGKPVVSYDITSSQCIFFALTVREESKDVRIKNILAEIQKYCPGYIRNRDEFLQKECHELRREKHSDIPYTTLFRYRGNQLDKEIKQLFQILSGDFYRFLMEKAGITWGPKEEFQKKRDQFKGKFFEFLYGPNRRRGRIFHAFQRTFPYITILLWKMKNLGGMYQRVQELKAEGKTAVEAWREMKKESKKEKKFYVGLPLKMQTIEAEFMFGKVAPKIDRSFVPIHDSILVEKSERRNIKDVGKLLKDEFRKLGVDADIKKEEW